MSYTNLILGGNWPLSEWPEYVEVGHEGAVDSARYVPGRTCRDECEGTPQSFLCGACGWFYTDIEGDELGFSYCPNCGAGIAGGGEHGH